MPTDKFKIYLPPSMKGRLSQDAELFDFVKRDGGVNLNAFLRTLVVNYLQQYSVRMSIIQAEVATLLIERTGVSVLAAESLAADLLATMSSSQDSKSEKSVAITLTVGDEAYETMCYIANHQLKGRCMSQYMKEMLASYLEQPRNKREEVVFKETFATVRRAIKNKRVLSITSRTVHGHTATVMPYTVASSKGEQFNYLLCYDIDARRVRSYRMSRLGKAFIQNETYHMDDETMAKLKLAERNAPQFSFQEAETSCVRFTEEGIRKFGLMHTNRPVVTKRENDLFYFEWPITQLIEYFKRYGKDAVVLTPTELHDAIQSFYREGEEAYSATEF